MIISTDPPFIFVHVWKTGGTSIASCLSSQVPGAQRPRTWMEWPPVRLMRSAAGLPVLGKHSYAVDIRSRYGMQFDRSFSFAFVRNPWDWLVSFYKFVTSTQVSPDTGKAWRHHLWPVVGRMTFEDFISWVTREHGLAHTYVRRHSSLAGRVPVLQKDWIVGTGGEVIVNFVGRFERLAEDFVAVANQLGMPQLSLPHVNRTAHDEYRSFYTPPTREAVANYFAPDIELFEYGF